MMTFQKYVNTKYFSNNSRIHDVLNLWKYVIEMSYANAFVGARYMQTPSVDFMF